MIITVLIGTTSITAFAADDIDYSFYRLSSNAAECFSRKLAPDTNKPAGTLKANENDQDKMTVVLQYGGSQEALNSGNGINAAGNYLAFAESQSDGGWIGGWILSLLSSSSSTYSYDIFDKVTLAGSGDSSKTFLRYCAYGSMLETIGIDKTSTEGFNFLRLIAGGLMILAYSVALFVDSVFIFVIKILKFLNPFQLFSLVQVSRLGYQDAGMFNNGGKWVIGPDDWIYPVASAVSELYERIHDFAWVAIVPIFFALAIFSAVIVINRGQRRYMGQPTGMYDIFKKLFIRLLFLVAGVPLLGATYSAALDGIENALSGDQRGSFITKVVGSTFVDFESWAANTNLVPPSTLSTGEFTTSVVKDSAGHVSFRPTNAAYSSLRSTCLEINKTAGIFGNSFSNISVDKNTDLNSDANLTYDTTPNTYVSGLAEKTGGDADYKTNSRSVSESEVIYDLLNRYTQSYFYHASDYETKCKASYVASSDDSEGWKKWFEYLGKGWDYWDDFKPFNGEDDMSADAAKRVLFSGGLYGSEQPSASGYSYGAAGHDYIYYGTSDTNKGLSDLSMYNYLSSDFAASSLKCYSNLKSSSGFVRRSHFSVNLIGSGMLPALYWFNAMTMLICYTVIGIGYAFAMLVNNVMRTVRSITSLPFAMLGSIPAIAKSITYVLIMILEVVITLFAFALVSDFLFAITGMIEGLLTTAVNAIFGTITVSDGSMLSVGTATPVVIALVLIVQIIFVIWFTAKAMKVRKAIVKSVDEAAGGLIDRLIVANSGGSAFAPHGAVGGGAAPLLRGAAMGGAASAAQGRSGKGKGIHKGVLGGMPGIGVGSAGGTNGGAGGDGGAGGGIVSEGGFGGTNDVINTGGDTSIMSSMSGSSGGTDVMNTSAGANGASAMDSSGGAGGAGGSGSPGAGQAASAITNERYAENNQEQSDKSVGEKMSQMTSLTGQTREQRQQSKDIREAETEQNIRTAMGEGGGTTATADVDYDKNKAVGTIEAKKAAFEKMGQSAEQTAVGVGEAIAGAYTGQAGLVKDGAKNAGNGALGMKDAQAASKNASTSGAAQAMQQREVEAQRAESNNANYGGNSSSTSSSSSSSNTMVNGQSTAVTNQGGTKTVQSASNVDRSSAKINEGNTTNSLKDESQTNMSAKSKVSASKRVKTAGSTAQGGKTISTGSGGSKGAKAQNGGTPLRQKSKYSETRTEQSKARRAVAENHRAGKTPNGNPKGNVTSMQSKQQQAHGMQARNSQARVAQSSGTQTKANANRASRRARMNESPTNAMKSQRSRVPWQILHPLQRQSRNSSGNANSQQQNRNAQAQNTNRVRNVSAAENRGSSGNFTGNT